MLKAPNLCSRCQKRLGPQAIRAAGGAYHPHCFVCSHCQKPLEKTFYPKGDRLYHQACYEKLFMPRCDQCGQAIRSKYTRTDEGRFHPECYTQRHGLTCALCGETIRGRYLYDHWGHKTHPEHGEGGEKVPVLSCHVCARLIAPQADKPQSGRLLSDGRALCAPCHQSEIVSFAQIQAAKLEVIAQMHAVGFDYIPDYIKVELSEDQQLLNQRLRASPTGNIHGFTRTAQRNIPGYGLILEHSISVLGGLPRVAFMSVLAHELLHVWIHENNLRHLSHAEVEGFCNLGSALICHNALKAETEYDAALARVLLQRMQEDPDPAYGEGYRAMAWRLQNQNWPALIAALKDAATPLPLAPPEVLAPQTRELAPPPPQAPPQPKAPSDSESAAERLQKLKAQFQSQASKHSAPTKAEAQAAPTETSSSSAAAQKVRERFAQKPVSQLKKGTGSKLGKLGKANKKTKKKNK